MKRTRMWTAVSAAFVIASIPGLAAAEYPNKPVTLVVQYPAGGAADLAARTLASVAPNYVNGAPVLVVNRTGAGGVTGSLSVKNSAKDGYTLLLARIGSQVGVPAINPNAPYKWHEFTMLGLLETNPFVCAVNSKSPYNTLADLAEAMKANPGKLSYAHPGFGTLPHFAVVMMLDGLGISVDAVKPIPYKGGPAMTAAIVGNHVDIICQNVSALIGQIQGGNLRALVITTGKRFGPLKDVPTANELGVPGLNAAIGWSALYGPPGLSDDVVSTWAAALQKIKGDKAWLTFTRKLGSLPSVESPEATYKFVENQFKTFRALAVKLDLLMK